MLCWELHKLKIQPQLLHYRIVVLILPWLALSSQKLEVKPQCSVKSLKSPKDEGVRWLGLQHVTPTNRIIPRSVIVKWKRELFVHFSGGKSFYERIIAKHKMPKEKVNCFRVNCLISQRYKEEKTNVI